MLLRLARTVIIRQKHKFTELEWGYYKELENYFEPLYKTFTPYQDKVDSWQRTLARRQRQKANARRNAEEKQTPAPQPPKLVVHDPAVGVKMPVDRDQLFLIARIGNSLHKLTRGQQLVLKNTRVETEIGQQHVVDDIKLVGSPEFTLLGRPSVSAKAFCKVLEKPLSEKLVVFKKKRRKQYKWNMGWREQLLVLEVQDFEFEIPQDLLGKAISLI